MNIATMRFHSGALGSHVTCAGGHTWGYWDAQVGAALRHHAAVLGIRAG